MRRLLLIGAGLAARLMDLAARWSRRRTGVAVVYHALDDAPGDPRRELVPALPAEVFALHVACLRRRYRVVPASELVAAVRTRRRGQRIPAAITFDDDLQSHVDLALPVLRQEGVPATFYLCGTSAAAPFRYWWQRLQAAADAELDLGPLLERFGLAPNAVGVDIGHVGAAVEAMTPARRREFADALGELLGPDPASSGLRADAIRALRDAGCEIGFHTRDHDPLAFLDDDRLAAAMRDGRTELEAVAGTQLTSIAYPHGSADGRVAAAARAAGFTTGYSLAAEPVVADDETLLLGRLERVDRDPRRFLFGLARVALRARREGVPA